VAYLFEQKGRFDIPADVVDEMTLFEIVVEAGAEEVDSVDGTYVVTTSREAFSDVGAALDDADLDPAASDLVRSPTTTVTLDPEDQNEVTTLIENIDDLKDVEAVYTTLQVNGTPLALGTDVETIGH
jgi:transcriptional/translational regulatory protein YebC/TACO1